MRTKTNCPNVVINGTITAQQIISDKTISLLRKNFGTPLQYIAHLQMLDKARLMIYPFIEDGTAKEDAIALFNTLNQLYGVLFNLDVYHDCMQSLDADNTSSHNIV